MWPRRGDEVSTDKTEWLQCTLRHAGLSQATLRFEFRGGIYAAFR